MLKPFGQPVSGKTTSGPRNKDGSCSETNTSCPSNFCLLIGMPFLSQVLCGLYEHGKSCTQGSCLVLGNTGVSRRGFVEEVAPFCFRAFHTNVPLRRSEQCHASAITFASKKLSVSMTTEFEYAFQEKELNRDEDKSKRILGWEQE